MYIDININDDVHNVEICKNISQLNLFVKWI